MSLHLQIAEALFEQAVREPYGLLVQVHVDSSVSEVIGPTRRAQQMLYRFRKELPDPTYRSLKIALDPVDPANRLWLINMEGEAAPLVTAALEDSSDA